MTIADCRDGVIEGAVVLVPGGYDIVVYRCSNSGCPKMLCDRVVLDLVGRWLTDGRSSYNVS